MIGMLLYLAISIFIYIYQPIIAWLFICFVLISKSFNFKMLLLCIFFVFTFRTSINLCQPIESGKVVELNNKSIIVRHHFTNVLISVSDVSQYALQDEIIIYDVKPLEFSSHRYGFNLENWSKSRNICYKAHEQDTFKHEGKGILNWLSKGGLNKNQSFIELSRLLLFQSNPNQELDLFVSMGIIYSLIIRIIQLCFLRQNVNRFEAIFVSLIFLYLSYHLSWPISLIRVWVFYLSSKFIHDRIVRFSINLIVCAFINPYGLTQLAFVLPLMFQFTSIFMPLKSKFIQRSLVLVVTLVSFNHSYSLLNIVLYPMLYTIYRYLILFSLILSIFPFFSSIYVYLVEIVDSIYNLSLKYGVIKGHISVFYMIMFLVIYHISTKYKIVQLLLMSFIVIFGIRLLSIPLFYTVTMINVGQGDSILIQAPLNQSVLLIDTGPPSQYRALKSFLDAQAIDKIDYLIITHDDNDHSGNVETLSNEFYVSELVLKGKDIENDWIFLDYLEFNQSNILDNDASLTYYTNIHNTRFLLLGDLSTIGETQLISKYSKIKADVLKLGHHGSKTSTSDDLLKQIQAKIGLISVGINNYGHPSYEVINRLKDYAIYYFDSYFDGDVQIILTPLIRYILNSNAELYFYE